MMAYFIIQYFYHPLLEKIKVLLPNMALIRYNNKPKIIIKTQKLEC